ncbi:MAG: glycosyltransferase [Candidatus Pacebacteria bacterium]|nr:glycosyltransferase [Candidatus Paceibacterota bacterium]MDD5357049.1 glycosyltransferase [Candidatus Paceibacterota bacterium]
MRIAIFHDQYNEIGGAELTVLMMARALQATIITTNIDYKKIGELGYGDIAFISIGRVPLSSKGWKQIAMQYRFWNCDFSSQFDFFIFGGCASIYAAKKHKRNLWFCFSPYRGIYDLRYFYTSRFHLPLQAAIELLILFDKYFAKYARVIITSSMNVARRIHKYYHRDSLVYYIPVQVSNFYSRPHKNYWLCVTRLTPYKRVELQLKAFAKLPREKLIIVGGASEAHRAYFTELKKKAPTNVAFVGAVYDLSKIAEFYAYCKGFIITARDEDFGTTPIEAMASGKPVIAPNDGGNSESIVHGKTGILIDDINEDKIVEAVKEIGKDPEKYKEACLEQAKRFGIGIFIEKIRKEIYEQVTKA